MGNDRSADAFNNEYHRPSARHDYHVLVSVGLVLSYPNFGIVYCIDRHIEYSDIDGASRIDFDLHRFLYLSASSAIAPLGQNLL